jgi:hypothetical protein
MGKSALNKKTVPVYETSANKYTHHFNESKESTSLCKSTGGHLINFIDKILEIINKIKC